MSTKLGSPPGPPSMDEETWERVRQTLSAVVPDIGETLVATTVAGGRSNPTFGLTDGLHQWILRRPPFGMVLDSAHDMKREFTVISALHDSSVPVPRPVQYCDEPGVMGVPYIVLERVQGWTLRSQDDARTLAPHHRSALADAVVDTLIQLHAIDPRSVGLSEFGRPDGYLDRQLRRWAAQAEQLDAESSPAIKETLSRLAANMPSSRRSTLVHGDYKMDNIMISSARPDQVAAVLDWEMSTLGDPLADLGLLLSFWDEPGEPENPLARGTTAVEGFPTRDAVMERYAHGAGADLEEIDWYITFADLKLSVILTQIGVRYSLGMSSGDDVKAAAGMVQPFLDRAIERTARSSLFSSTA